MIDKDETGNSQANTLCKSCGLCCSGHLFSWVRLKATELDSSQALGLNVIRSDPRQRGFTQPCPLWNGQCTIYTSPDYPRVCHNYKCKLLKELLDENVPLPNALMVVQQANTMILELEALLPTSTNVSFRERLVARLEDANAPAGSEFRLKAEALLAYFKTHFGVADFTDESFSIFANAL